jgi:hypothetical protein
LKLLLVAAIRLGHNGVYFIIPSSTGAFMSQVTESSSTPIGKPPPMKAKAMEHVLPMRNQPALAGYYCAIFSLVPIAGLFLGPAAIGYGIVGLDRGNRLPNHIGYGHALFAIVAGTVGSIISYGMAVAIAVVLALNFMGGMWPFPHELPDQVPLEQFQPHAGPGKLN